MQPGLPVGFDISSKQSAIYPPQVETHTDSVIDKHNQTSFPDPVYNGICISQPLTTWRTRHEKQGFHLDRTVGGDFDHPMLTAILLPALGSARRTTRTTMCLSNIRQIGLGVMNAAEASANVEQYRVGQWLVPPGDIGYVILSK